MKLSRMAIDPRKPRMFNPTKVKAYTVHVYCNTKTSLTVEVIKLFQFAHLFLSMLQCVVSFMINILYGHKKIAESATS